MITVLYFARLRETLGMASENLLLPSDVMNVKNLQEWLKRRGDIWVQEFERNDIRIAVNQEMANLDTKIKDGDEVAFFPPITGG